MTDRLVIVHVRVPGWGECSEQQQLRCREDTEQALTRLRTRMVSAPITQIENALADELNQASGGQVDQADLAVAAQALHRGDYLTVRLR